MTKTKRKEQPTLFERKDREELKQKAILFALGDFQSRGFELIDRELPLDRLRGAFKRATDNFEVEELSDEESVQVLEDLGARVVKVPSYVAAHPYRITVDEEIANLSLNAYKAERGSD